MTKNYVDIEQALIDIVEHLQESGLDMELEAGQNGEGPVAMALLALGMKNIYEISELDAESEE